jgi:hypothetical protein
VVLWLNDAGVHAVVLWQVSQVCGNPVWLGAVVALSLAKWHETQVMGSPLYTLFPWQVAQDTVVCLPVSGKRVVLWLNVAPGHCVVVWHSEQSCE